MKNNVVSRTVVRQMIRSAIKDPEKNIPKMLSMLEIADVKGVNSEG